MTQMYFDFYEKTETGSIVGDRFLINGRSVGEEIEAMINEMMIKGELPDLFIGPELDVFKRRIEAKRRIEDEF